ncbi:1-aminocyclopropane-1-carboxylate deaminase/D-cysteine desulfhydrase [Aquimarina brevivitae]|uniref:1-aminocyclopropane-1-carboxylate deaminase n=1 Tax=Aquimarina brevivitae TaxID=323412 RepID=A0A4Q7P0K0_9FLAO|nr:pyridoxal-phosphate dependent enzyme [Aquimarina brevivitae]RZS92172.1 1-aminocyclopropane-1-carboxylate deaminase [Aquimarina brevivitae]
MDFFSTKAHSPNHSISSPFLQAQNISLVVKREDVLHPQVSGNKFRKLKYNIEEAIKNGNHKILTFGGAFSNHIAATAAAGKLCNIQTIGVIRGEELAKDVSKTLATNPTLRFATEQGMVLHFVDRASYRQKNELEFINELKAKFGEFYLIPEGGANELAVKGCEEILDKKDEQYDVICCSSGTGTTVAGIINSSKKNQRVLSFSALQGNFLTKEIQKYANTPNWELISHYTFGGYAKVNTTLIQFINSFNQEHGILLDPIYTGKMIFGIFDLIKQNYFAMGTKILAIHTGGIQGISGMNAQLKKKGLPLIDI